MKPAQVVGTLVGLALMAAPAVLGYADALAADVHRTVGPLVASFAVMAFWPVLRDLRWVNPPLVAALVVAPLVGGHPAAATVVAAIATLAVVATSPFGGPDPHQRGTGWRGLVNGP
jgi:hypothetical protein